MSIYTYIRRIYSYMGEKRKKIYLDGLVSNGLQLGKNVCIVSDYFFDPTHCFLISIGDNCTIAPNVRLIAHDASIYRILGYTKIGKIDIKENCFIGDSTIVLPNVKIGPNSIVGAGSVVTKDVPPNMIVAGNPAKVITTAKEYISKINSISCDKKIFDESYSINNLDESKRKEVIESIGETIGFIV